MPKKALTAKVVESIKTDQLQTEVSDGLVPGLVLRIGRGGTKAYYLRYRNRDRQLRRLKLGTHPVLSLADARAKARDELRKAQEGEDPASDRKARPDDTSFRAMAREVLARKAEKTRRVTQDERRRILEAELLPKWGDRPAASITRREVVELLDAIADRDAPVMANRTGALIKALYNGAIKRRFPSVESNPAALLEAYDEGAGRGRYLERHELRILWRALEWESPVIRSLFRIIFLTGARQGSVCKMRWQDITPSNTWIIPEPFFKGRRPFAVPLSDEAMSALEPMRQLTGDRTWIFPAGTQRVKEGEHPISSLNKALCRVRARTGLPHFTLHDSRRTLRTWGTRPLKPSHPSEPAGLGIAPPIIDEVLGHQEESLWWRRYTGDRTMYLIDEKRAALAAWGRFVAAAVSEEG